MLRSVLLLVAVLRPAEAAWLPSQVGGGVARSTATARAAVHANQLTEGELIDQLRTSPPAQLQHRLLAIVQEGVNDPRPAARAAQIPTEEAAVLSGGWRRRQAEEGEPGSVVRARQLKRADIYAE